MPNPPKRLSALAALGVVVCLTAGAPGLGARQAAEAGASAQDDPLRLAGASILIPGTRGGVLSTIQGSALSSSNISLRDTAIRLRDVQVGRVVDATTSDLSGAFAFRPIGPGSYIVEIIEKDGTVLATSQMLRVSAGEAVSTIVKMPFRIPPSAGALEQMPRATARDALVAAAASTGMLTSGPIDSCVSGPCR